MLNIIDDFVKPRLQDEIENMLLGNNFPYFYVKESVIKKECGFEDDDYIGDTKEDESTLNVPQFFHMFVDSRQMQSQYYNQIVPISNKLMDIIDTDCYITRCKVNMNTVDTRFENKYHTPHIDNAFEDQITAIYYVNDSDGDTLFFDAVGNISERITPKKGRLVWWKGRKFHAKSSPIKTTQRVVLNFNLLPYGDKE